MKKIIIFIIVLILLLGSLPIIGNQIIEKTLDKKIERLESKGLQVLKKEQELGYLNTSRHYEILLDGTKYGIDLKYSNIPFTEAVSLDLYPLSVPKDMINNLEQKDKGFADFIEKFVENKGILYHINYNLIDGHFDGFMKDIDEKYTMSNKSTLKVEVLGSSFEGKGDVRLPSNIQTSLKKVSIEVKDAKDSITLNIDNIHFDAISDFSSEKSQLDSRVYFDNMRLVSNSTDLNVSTFNYDINVSNINQQAYKEFIRSNQSQEALLKLLSFGADINISELSFKNINKNKENLGGLSLSSNMHLSADKNLAFKVQISPLLALSNLEIDFKSKTSKKIMDEVMKDSLIPSRFIKYRTTSGNNVVFDLSYMNGVLIVNGKKILG